LFALDKMKEHDYCTYQHSLIVFALTTFLIKIYYPERAVDKDMLLIGPTHDLGKLCIPRDILNKRTPLTRQERQYLDFHAIAGYVLLGYYLGNPCHLAAQVALNHHERRNGAGYPRGISQLDPLIEMVAACDIYDALISPRPYRQSNYDNRTALEELSFMADNGVLGLDIVKALIGCNRSGHPSPEQVKVSREKRGKPPLGNCFLLSADE
jgi:HD-GYP domain-containing protein (c-di-GMP phosphodiesterase class II)